MTAGREARARDAGETLIVGFPGAALPDELGRALARGDVRHTVIFKRNIHTLEQLWALLRGAAAQAGGPRLVAVDQEGGRVARLGAPVLALPPMATLGALEDPELVRRVAVALGRQLRALGFNVDFAPVLDVHTEPANPIIGDRAFGTTPDAVIRRAMPFADGLAEAGVLACGKHFPGHGDTTTDSHLELPRLDHDLARLEAVELAPFRAARGRVPMLMTAHVVFESLDPGIPATLSHRVLTDLLRGKLGYDGVIVSDDLEMHAIDRHYAVPDAACAAIEAGCDALLVCSRPELALEAHDALVERAGRRATFAARLRDAARRVRALAARVPPVAAPSAEALAAALADEDAAAVRRELAARLARASS